MKLLVVIAMTLVMVLMLQSAGRTLYIHLTEFEPATREWKEAKKVGDHRAMDIAYQKQIDAHRRTFDPFWFVKQ